jgi:glycosidase/fibronectin type 3 domain-containing protein
MARMRRVAAAVAVAGLLVCLPSALASHTPPPATVTIAGSLQSELGCSGDWQADCAATHLAYDASDEVWQGTFAVPAGDWEYKAPLNDAWNENYGLHAKADGTNIPLSLAAPASVKFYYDHESHWVTDNRSSTIAVAPGSFQSELGCPGDWMPDCLRSWLQDPDGDGVYTFETTGLPAGSYETKVAINEAWDQNYGQGGVPGGANIPFTVPAMGAKVVFRYVAATHVLTVLAGHGPDGNVESDGLRHDSRDTLYRTPGGAVPAGTPVLLRLRTFHDDVTSVRVRLFDVDGAGQSVLPMSVAASDVSCYQPGLEAETCDFWQVRLPNANAATLWYRFIVSDGADTDYYADNTPALDGGAGTATDDPVDQSWALTVYEPSFTAPLWARSAFVYQIFPDRFRNAVTGNDPVPGAGPKRFSTDPRYAYPGGDPGGSGAVPAWDQILELGWDELPEGYCRNYSAGACPQRFPQPAAAREGPRGRDYYGGDLQGVAAKLGELASLGVTAVYLNPIFDAGSNHGYDTQDYRRIEPYLGGEDGWKVLTKEARRLGIRLILDGVFNHMSSDSPAFDRYHHSRTLGACESVSSPYRSWFDFNNTDIPCGTGDYEGWFGFDSIPVLLKGNPAVQQEFLQGIAPLWLQRGAAGWRLDVSGDPSFPNGYWEQFRRSVKAIDPNALTISETWQKDSTLLRMLRGDRLDSTMNYRLRDAVLGLLAPGPFDSKGFADSGRTLAASEFAARLASIREDYADAAYFSLMNLLDSHDTERLLWTLTPGAETRAAKEQDAANVADGKRRLRLASLIQFTLAGSPTVFYGDEVGLTGDDDPDDRRPYPWADKGGSPDGSLRAHYTALAALRKAHGSLTDGDFRVLLADDAAGTVAYGRESGTEAAIVALNRSGSPRTLAVPVGDFVPTGSWTVGYAVGGSVPAPTVAGGHVQVTLPALGGAVLLTAAGTDLAAPAAPTGLHVTSEGAGQVGLAWSGVGGAASYDVYRSPLSGGGWVKANGAPITGTDFTDTGLRNGRTVYYVVRALDAAGNASASSNEVSALPHLTIGWANLQWPPTLTHVVSAVQRTDNVYGQVWIDGVTSQAGPTPTLRAQLGFGPDGSNPDGNAAWTWVDAAFNTDVGNNDEFVASLLPESVGTFDYAYRYSTTDGRDWVYADLDGIGNGYSAGQAGSLTVTSSGDTTAPDAPANLHVVAASPEGVELAWDAVSDASLAGYEVRRSDTAGGPYTTLALVTATTYTDPDVVQGGTYHYVVRAVDTSFNRSQPSAEVTATAELRTVELVFNVTVPAPVEDAVGRSVYIAGFLDRLDGDLPQWDAGGVVLTKVDDTHWTITLHGKESTQIEYKYALGSFDFVEKDGACGEIANRLLTLSYGATGKQTVNDTVPNWRNVDPCGS